MSEVTEPSSQPTSPVDEVVRLCRDLIRIDSTNYGDGSGPGEREAADYVVAQLREVGPGAHGGRERPRPDQRGGADRGGGP